jgi:Holliday junction resolvase
MTLPLPTEEVEQRLVVQYLELKGCKYTAIPNSTYTKSWKQKMKNKATGLRAGFPDLVIIASNHFFCIEMKRTKGGTVTPEQKAWHEALRAANAPTYVCKGFDEAKKIIDHYLQGGL